MTKFEMASINIFNGEEIYYRKRSGGSKIILLVHGNMTSSKHWDLLMESLSSDYTIYALDQRGFGKSSYNNRISNIKQLSDDLQQFCDMLNLKNFYLVGWSTGSAVSMKFVADHPGYAAKLAMLSPISTRGYPSYKKDAEQKPVERLTSREEIERELTPLLEAFQKKDREVVRQIWNQLIYVNKKPSPYRYEEYLDDILTQRNLVDIYHALNRFNISEIQNGIEYGTGESKRIDIPTMILWGELDKVITKQMIKEIISDLGKDPILKTNEKGGHNLMIDDLNWVIDNLESFFNA